MKISIITPSYNQGQYIEQTIQSVLSQQGDFELEYIIIDGQSTDQTLSILKKYAGQLKWISEKDNGQTEAINKGFGMATGEVLAYLNSDDLYSTGTLSKVAAHFKNNSSCKWVTGKCRIIDEQGQEVRRWITAYKIFCLKRYSYNYLLAENFISQPATFWRREVLETVGMFDEKQQLVMDYEYWLRVGEKYQLDYIDDYLADFRWYPGSKSGNNFYKQFKEELGVAKQFALGRKWPIWLHQLNYYKIVGIYTLMKFWRK
jgi:glycosyltransferase involved in cell wall biosynthesis